MRNNHEYKLGHFKNAIPANTMSFRELDKVIDNYKKDF
jgi:predicted sulfurtransferase